jgi:synaptobrevin family protein YKT6
MGGRVGGDPVLLAAAEDLTPLPWFTRASGKASEFMVFLSRTFAAKTAPGQRQGCQEGDYNGWVYQRQDGLSAVVLATNNYDRRVAFDLVQKGMAAFEAHPDNWAWAQVDADVAASASFQAEMAQLVARYQKPEQADSILRCLAELESTKIVLHRSIECLLDRGQKIDDLAAKSADLSATSKHFLKKSQKLNSWCTSCSVM